MARQKKKRKHTKRNKDDGKGKHSMAEALLTIKKEFEALRAEQERIRKIIGDW